MFRIARILIILISTVHTAVALAQEGLTTNMLDIKLIGPLCSNVKTMSVVVEGADQKSFPAEKISECHWQATRKHTFNTEWTSFSLRLNIARTGCKRATADTVNGKPMGSLEFHCCGSPMHDVEIMTPGRIPVFYRRTIAAGADDDEDSSACTDDGAFKSEHAVIQSVWYSEEALKLPANKRYNPRGMPVETLRIYFGERGNKTEPLLIFNDASVTKHLDPGKNVLSAKDISAAGVEQYCRGLLGAPPSCSSNVDTVEETRLKELGLDHMVVKVPK